MKNKYLYLTLFVLLMVNSYGYEYYFRRDQTTKKGNRTNYYFTNENGDLQVKRDTINTTNGNITTNYYDIFDWIIGSLANIRKSEYTLNDLNNIDKLGSLHINNSDFENYLKNDIQFLNDFYTHNDSSKNSLLNYLYNENTNYSEYSSIDFNNEDYEILYNEDGKAIESIYNGVWKGLYKEDEINTSGELYNKDGELLYNNGESLKTVVKIPVIIDMQSLEQEMTNKISVVVCVCLGGFCCFLVVKKGLKWCRYYLGNSERQEKINNGWYEIEQGRFVPPVSDKIPSVVNDGGVWIDVLHDERYVGNMSIENYFEMRWANLYDKYVNESSRLVNTNKRVLDFNQFKALAESRKINASTVDDESFTRQIVDEQLKGSIDTEQKQRRNYKRKYYPRKQYFAIRNYYRRKKTSQPIVTQPVLLPPPVPQQTVVKPDESLTDDEYREKYKSQLDDYIINKTPENKVYMDVLMERHRNAHNISKTQWDNSPSEFARKADEIERNIPIWDDTDTPF